MPGREPLDLDAIAKAHQRRDPERSKVAGDQCGWCARPWPCDASRLLSDVREVREELEQLRGERDELRLIVSDLLTDTSVDYAILKPAASFVEYARATVKGDSK